MKEGEDWMREPTASEELFSAAREASDVEAGSLVIAVYETGAWLATCLEAILRELSNGAKGA